MINRDRFKDAAWFNAADKVDVLVGGVGGTGSYLTFLLARNGANIVVFDDDIIESHNLGGQLYSTNYIGKSKVDSMGEIVKNFSDTYITTFQEKVTSETMTNTYVFACFDNMKARKEMFEAWVKGNEGNPDALFVDMRLIMEQATIFNVVNVQSEIDKYRKSLFDDSEVEDASCTARQTSYGAAMIASHAVNFFMNHLCNVSKVRSSYVPFFWEYYMPIDLVNHDCPYLIEEETIKVSVLPDEIDNGNLIL